MRNTWLTGLFWLFWAACSAAGGENQGGIEAEVQQGELARWSVWWRPGAGGEGRFWWEPQGGGSAWVRVGGLQAGPLAVVPGAEGTRGWGPGTRLSSGNWGLALAGEWGGVWAVQTPATLEAGLQTRGRWGSLALASGGDRRWVLAPVSGPRWTDRLRAGGTWDGEGWGAGGEAEWEAPELASPRGRLRGRLTGNYAGWEAEVRPSWVSETGPSFRGRAGWTGRFAAASCAWGSSEGWSARLSAEIEAGTVWGAGTELEQQKEGWKAGGEVWTAGKTGAVRWKASWSLSQGAKTVQKVAAQWREPGLEAEAGWRVEGLRLGWFGPGARFELTLRWLF